MRGGKTIFLYRGIHKKVGNSKEFSGMGVAFRFFFSTGKNHSGGEGVQYPPPPEENRVKKYVFIHLDSF